MKRFFTLVLLSFCFVHLGFTQNNNVIDPELYVLMNSRSGDKISVNIILKENVDASSLNVRKAFYNEDAKRTYMVNELKTQSEKLQADVLKTLKAVERSSQVTNINCHWLTNMINCTATPDAIMKIAEHPDVKAVIHNKKEYMLFDEKSTQGTPTRAYNGTNVEKINAHKVWDLGYTGEGIIVAVIDTGVNADHVDLKDHL
jgi:subtilisin family serine protease